MQTLLLLISAFILKLALNYVWFLFPLSRARLQSFYSERLTSKNNSFPSQHLYSDLDNLRFSVFPYPCNNNYLYAQHIALPHLKIIFHPNDLLNNQNFYFDLQTNQKPFSKTKSSSSLIIAIFLVKLLKILYSLSKPRTANLIPPTLKKVNSCGLTEYYCPANCIFLIKIWTSRGLHFCPTRC